MQKQRPEHDERCKADMRLYRNAVLESGKNTGDQRARASSLAQNSFLHGISGGEHETEIEIEKQTA